MLRIWVRSCTIISSLMQFEALRITQGIRTLNAPERKHANGMKIYGKPTCELPRCIYVAAFRYTS